MEYSSSLLLFVHLSFVLCASTNSLNATTKSFIKCLNTHYPQNSETLISQVTLTPKNSSYTSVLDFSIQNLRFTSPSTNKPSVIVTPVNESQIQTVLFCSKENKIQLRIRCGGHDFEGLSYSTRTDDIPFVMIDMINLRSVDVDIENGTVWIGGGANLGEVYYRIAQKSSTYGFTGGVSSTVGIGGFISGGGYGSLKRKYGLAADNVIDVRFMDVNGRILDRESMGEDLFWAIRGGIASSFGVVLAWKVNLVEVPEIVTIFAVHRTLEQNGTELLYKWQSIAPTIDRDLYLRVHFLVVNQDGKRTIQISFESLFLGGANRLLSVMKNSFPELGLVREDCMEVSWIESMLFFIGDGSFSLGTSVEVLLNRSAPPKPYNKAKSDFVQVPIPMEGLEGIWERFFQLDDGVTNILMTPYGGKMDEYSESALPFPHRAGNLYMMYTAVAWQADTPVAEQQRRLDFLNSLYNYLGSYVSKNPRQAYVNYNDLDIGVGTSYEEAKATWGAQYFKNNFDRLVQVKSTFDPDNFFKHEQSIPTFTTKSASRAEF